MFVPITVISSLTTVFFYFLAMPHRGRLNLLTVLLQYSPAGLFHKIKGGSELPDDLGAEGDVLSHLGRYLKSSLLFFCVQLVQDNWLFSFSCFSLTFIWRSFYTYQSISSSKSFASWLVPYFFSPVENHLILDWNKCSLLEAINPVALGKTRAKQYALLKNSPKDCKLGDRVMCVQLHGDASFTGQGVVMESLGLSEYANWGAV